MSAAKTVTATFTLKQRTLTVTPAGTGSGFVDSAPTGIDCGENIALHADCTEDYADGTSVTLTAHPSANSDFIGFTGGGCSGAATTCIVSMDAAKTVTATFAPTQRTLTVTPAGTGSGFVDSSPAGVDCGRNITAHADCTQDYDDGTSVTLTAHPSANTDFAGFTGGCVNAGTTCTTTMSAAKTVTATFALKQRTLTVSTSGTGGGFVDRHRHRLWRRRPHGLHRNGR